MFSHSSFSGNQEFERLLREGITAAKNDQRRIAQSLLRQAIMLNGADARPYIWLSATTDDEAEKREYLEQAVAVDPSNAAARRGLALLTGQIDPSRLTSEGAVLSGMAAPAAPPATAGAPDGQNYQLPGSGNMYDAGTQAQSQSFVCPRCGGHMSFSVEQSQLVCEYCGFVKAHQQGSISPQLAGGQVLDFVMPTTQGHNWAATQHRLACEHCGAVMLLAPGEKAAQCSYCGSNKIVISAESSELIDPHLILLMKVDPPSASKSARKWLGSGLFAPDDLVETIKRLQLRPAYYSCWVYDGTLEVPWSCEVKEGDGRTTRWVPRNGTEMRFFTDIIVPGVKSLTLAELSDIEPFNLADVEEFKPDYLAGWPALIYDRSVSDASLLAREKVMREVRNEIYGSVEPGREKRGLRTGAGKWSGVTFKHTLVPLWIGTYHYKHKEYHLVMNGQTGKVGGQKPIDKVKIIFMGISAVLLIALLLLFFTLLSGSG